MDYRHIKIVEQHMPGFSKVPHFPERVWEQNANGKWSSRPAKKGDERRRRGLQRQFKRGQLKRALQLLKDLGEIK